MSVMYKGLRNLKINIEPIQGLLKPQSNEYNGMFYSLLFFQANLITGMRCNVLATELCQIAICSWFIEK